MEQPRRRPETAGEQGHLMVGLLVAMTVMAIMLGAALPAWHTMAQREKETELIFRGEQYARAIGLYQARFANAAVPSIDVLVEQKYLRKKYKDPITGQDFDLISPNTPAAGAPNQPGRGGPPPSRGNTSPQQPQPLSGRSSQPGPHPSRGNWWPSTARHS